MDHCMLLRGGTAWQNPMIDMITASGKAAYHTLIDACNWGASRFTAALGTDRKNMRTFQVNHAGYVPGLDAALQLGDVVDGSTRFFRVFHEGMATPVPIKNGGTGATTSIEALEKLGLIIRDQKPPDSEGVDGMICICPY